MAQCVQAQCALALDAVATSGMSPAPLTMLVVGLAALVPALGAPSGFPKSGNGLWYDKPGTSWSKTWLPVGNGYLGAMMLGGTSQEMIQLNLESLWSGGPFHDPSYNGGNKQPDERAAMALETQRIRQTIFNSSIGEIDEITVLNTDAGAYGSYAGAGYFLSTLNTTGPVSNYVRWLDMDEATHHTTWTQSNISYSRETFCSHPTQSCSQHLSVTNSDTARLPSLTFAWTDHTEDGLPLPYVTCFDNSTLRVRGTADRPGMLYEILVRVSASGGAPKIACASTAVVSKQAPYDGGPGANATVTVTGARDAVLTWVGGTEYDLKAGDAAHGYSFKGSDPHAGLVTLLDTATRSRAFAASRAAHVSDAQSVLGKFKLDLFGGVGPAAADLAKPTDQLFKEYTVENGNPYLEWLLFNYGRYLLAGSARGVLPANLQGKWALGYGNPWSADYHANINLQMNYWAAETTNMGSELIQSLWDYMQYTWAPRGAYTAEVLYNITRGWVVHNEMNIFGHTGMKAYGNSAMWANYPEANAWMAMHIYDHFSYTNDVQWWKSQGYPLLKGIAGFHLDKLITDDHFKDGSLVTAPCNSPEQAPITLGCAHAQQLIWELLNAVEKGFAAAGDTDAAFLDEVKSKRAAMDKGIHIGSWSQLQEWKVEKDSPNDTHRHLSHLIGLYPGYSITGYDPALQHQPGTNGTAANYTHAQVLEASRVSLTARGNGTGSDADAGWEKVWRAAAWAQLGDAEEFYHILKYALIRDFGPNLYSLYNPFDPDPIFQIDANFGYPGAVMNALVQSPDTATLEQPLTVTLLPALPSAWSSGSIKGARVRGATLDLTWAGGRPTSAKLTSIANAPGRNVQVVYAGKIVSEFKLQAGAAKSIAF